MKNARKVVLCIALSLDGYIADSEGKVDFLFEKPRVEPDEEYKAFYSGVDDILFGAATYRQMVESICPDKWMYPGKNCHVLSGSLSGDSGDVRFTTQSPSQLVQTLRGQEGGDIWLFGGNRLIHSFLQEDLVDEYFLYHMPVLLGSGVPLFNKGLERRDLRLLSMSKVDETVKVRYGRAE